MNQLALTIQCAARTYQANRKTQAKRQAKAAEQAREDSAIYIQRVFRGGQGHVRVVSGYGAEDFAGFGT